MALFQPSNIVPSVLAGIGQGVIDSSENCKVTWQINGTSALKGYQIDFFANDTASTYVSSTGHTALSPAVYGTDEKGNIVPFTATKPNWATEYSVTNGNEYKLKIMQWFDSVSVPRYTASMNMTASTVYSFAISGTYYTFAAPANFSSSTTIDIHHGNLLVFGYASATTNRIYTATASKSSAWDGESTLLSGSSSTVTTEEIVVQNSATVFIARAKPVVSITNVPISLTAASYTFIGSYSQAQGDAIKWVRWQLRATLLDGVTQKIIDDTGNVTTGILQYTYDGFVEDTTYAIKLTVETENGVQSTTDWVGITTAYDIGDPFANIDAECSNDDGSFKISWRSDWDVPGTASGTYTLGDGRIILTSGASVTWDEVNDEPMSLEAPYSVAWKGNVPNEGTFSQISKYFAVQNCDVAKFSDDGSLLITSGSNGTDLYSVNGQTITQLQHMNTSYKYIAFNHAGTCVILGDAIFKIQNNAFVPRGIINDNESDVPSAFSADDLYLAHGGHWHSISSDGVITDSIAIPNVSYPVTNVAISPVTSPSPYRLLIVNDKTYAYGSSFAAPMMRNTLAYSNISNGKFSADGSLFVCVAFGKGALFSVDNDYDTDFIGFFENYSAQNIDICQNASTVYVAVATSDNGVRVYEYKNSTISYKTTLVYNSAYTNPVLPVVAFSPLATLLIAGFYVDVAANALGLFSVPASIGTATLLHLETANRYAEILITSDQILFDDNGRVQTIAALSQSLNPTTALIILYPDHADYYGYNDGYAVQYITNSIIWTQENIESVTLPGAQTCDWVYITSNTAYDYNGWEYTSKPTFDRRTMFFADFKGTLQGGVVGFDEADDYTIYRYDTESNELTRLYREQSGHYNVVKDFGNKSLRKYKYRIYFIDQSDDYLVVSESEELCSVLTSYYLYEAVEDNESANVFHVKKCWKFGNNRAIGGVSNGNAPEFLGNFTKYPLRQGVQTSPKSGTLTGLLSNFVDGHYEDTADQMQELYDLSLSKNHVFLKDTKGNLYEVHTSAPITQTVNILTRVQEVSVSISWQEVADASDAVLIQDPFDEGWHN